MRRFLIPLAFALSWPAIADVTVGTGGTFTACASANTCELPVPTHADGTDLILPVCGLGNDDSTLDINETGYANRVYVETTTELDVSVTIESKFASSEPSNLTCDSEGPLANFRGQVFPLSGVHADVFDATAVAGTVVENSNTYDPPAITTATANALVCSVLVMADGAPTVATGPSGYTVYISPNTGTGARLGFACITKASAGSEDPGTWGALDTADAIGFTVAFKAAVLSVDPDWDTPPSVLSQTDTAYTIRVNTNADADDVFCGLWAKDATPPADGAAVEAGTGARATQTAAATGADQDLVVTAPESPPWYIGDIYCVAKADTGEYSAVADGDLLDEALDEPTGKQRLTLTSIHATSPYVETAVEVGDTCTFDEQTDPSGYGVNGWTVGSPTPTHGEDGTLDYLSGGDISRQIIASYCYDVDSPANHQFQVVFSNLAPALIDDWPLSDELYELGVNPATDLSTVVADPEGDDITYSWTAEPPDWALSSTTGVISDGSPGACGSFTPEVTLTDEYGAETVAPGSVDIGPRIPSTSGMTAAEAIAALEALCP